MIRATHAPPSPLFAYNALTAKLKTWLKSWCRTIDSNSLQSSQFEKFKRDKSRIRAAKLQSLIYTKLAEGVLLIPLFFVFWCLEVELLLSMRFDDVKESSQYETSS